MKKIYILLSLLVPFLAYFIFEVHWPSWTAVIVLGFLISLTINSEKISESIKSSLLSIILFSIIFGTILQITHPDGSGAFIVYFVFSLVFNFIGHLAGFLSKSLFIKFKHSVPQKS